jgi:hypothetical protein
MTVPFTSSRMTSTLLKRDTQTSSLSMTTSRRSLSS